MTPDLLFADAELAALYDAWSPRRVRGDFDFYLPRVMTSEAVLDVGCGTGSMLHEARDLGHTGRLVGLDPAAGMLAQARKRIDIEWVLGDLASVGFEDAFDLVVMTGHAFQVLVDDEALRVALAAVRRALRPEGRFAFETRNPAARAWERWTPEHAREVDAPCGQTVRIETQLVEPFDGRTVSFTHAFSSRGWAQPKVSRSTLRFLTAAEVAMFLAEAALVIEAQFGDWDRSPIGDASPELIFIARAA